MAFRSVEQRLASRLLQLLDRFGHPAATGMGIDARFTQQELADMIGTSRETLATTVSSLRERRIVEMQNQNIVILDVDALSGLAER